MKPVRRCQRIFILSLLALSVLAPIVLVSNRLKSLSLVGENKFIEDFASVKYSTDALKLSVIELEDEEGPREPPSVVYKDGDLKTVVNYSSSNKTFGSARFVDDRGSENVVAKSETNEDQKNDRQSSSVSVGKEQSKQTTDQRGQTDPSRSRKAADEMVMQMLDQIARAKVHLQLSPPNSNSRSVKELRQRTKDVEQALGEATRDSELPRSARQKMRAMESTLEKFRHVHSDCSSAATKLRSMTYNSEERVTAQKNQVTYLVQLAARTTPKGLHCLSMRLTADYFALDPEKRELPNQHKSLDPDLYHIALFSDNVLACAVVLNSTAYSSMESDKLVFHVITDSLNLPAISMWFLLNPPGDATVQIQSMDNFKWLSDHRDSRMNKQSYQDPRYTSPLNHLRFYLPDMFPALDKILFLDHDVVVQRDLQRLWEFDMKGKVVGVVETCQEGESLLHQVDLFINFSDPVVAKNFDVKACTWAFGMNVFDLRAWRRKNLTAIYLEYLHLGLERPLWKLGSLPLGWLTFYNQTIALDRRWHALGLGYDSSVVQSKIEGAAVIHYNGAMKPWLDFSIRKYKRYWSKFVNYDHAYLQQCNIHQ